jgi:hypothetical protein
MNGFLFSFFLKINYGHYALTMLKRSAKNKKAKRQRTQLFTLIKYPKLIIRKWAQIGNNYKQQEAVSKIQPLIFIG